MYANSAFGTIGRESLAIIGGFVSLAAFAYMSKNLYNIGTDNFETMNDSSIDGIEESYNKIGNMISDF